MPPTRSGHLAGQRSPTTRSATRRLKQVSSLASRLNPGRILREISSAEDPPRRAASEIGSLDLPARFGFRSGDRGTHGSRSILLEDLRQLLAATSEHTLYDDYRVAIMEENVLGKGTASARLWAWKKLRELYGLDPHLTVFRRFRTLWEDDPEGRPLLAVLCACARDPLLRMSASTILKAPQGSVVTPEDLAEAIAEVAPDRFSPINLKAIGNRICSSWTQSGHLVGGQVRRRTRPTLTPGATVYALVLGRLCGARGQLLFSTLWASLLDAPVQELFEQAAAASQRHWIDLRRAGSVVEVGLH